MTFAIFDCSCTITISIDSTIILIRRCVGDGSELGDIACCCIAIAGSFTIARSKAEAVLEVRTRAVSCASPCIADRRHGSIHVVQSAVDALQCRNFSEIDACLGTMSTHDMGTITRHGEGNDDANNAYSHHQFNETDAYVSLVTHRCSLFALLTKLPS